MFNSDRLLTLQGAYYEENMGVLVDDMILQIHSLGEGYVRKDWIFVLKVTPRGLFSLTKSADK